MMELEDEYDDDEYGADNTPSSRIISLEMETSAEAEEEELRLEEMYEDSEQDEGMVALVNGTRSGNTNGIHQRRYNYDVDVDDYNEKHSFCYWCFHPYHLTYMLRQQRPYLPLYCISGIVFVVLLLSILYAPKHQEFLLPTNTTDKSSCGNFSNHEITKFLQDINRLPSKERCSKNHQANCQCRNPLIPSIPPILNPNNKSEEWAAPWNKAFQRNLDLVKQNINRHLDVVLLGDSITEHWLGTTFATPNPEFAENKQVYDELFQQGSSSSTTKGSVQGLALGIAGDRCSQLLYRLQNGEMGSNTTGEEGQQQQMLLKPSVWWILIGTNDFGTGDMCNDDSIVAGNIRIVQEIQQKIPNATIVIQSLLPVLKKINKGGGDGDDNDSDSGQQSGSSIKEQQQQQQQEPILWDSYSDINERLECFTTTSSSPYQNNLHFYNATPLFFNDDQRTVNKSLLPDGIHPEGKGSRVLGRGIVKKVQEIISNNKR